MNKKILILIGILIISISISLIFVTNGESTEKSSSGPFNYQNSEQVISDTYLGKSVSQWQKESHDSLMNYYENNGRDPLFTNLGALVMKNAMIAELDKQNITVTDLDFKVHSGMMLTSLPPHVSFEAFVNDTNNNTYRISGMAMKAQVSEPIHITKQQFFDTNEKLPLESITSPDNSYILHNKNNDEPRVIPRNLVVLGDKDIEINFQNDNSVPVRIQGNGDWQNPNWYGPTILPFTTATMTFDNYGVYEWHARTLPLPGSIASDHMGGGEILIIPSDMDKLTFQDKQQIGAAILQNFELPWSGMGSGNDKGITISFNPAIYDLMPNANEYYQARAEQLIPFDIPIIIETPYQ